MKTPEELNTLKEEYKSLQKKLSELTDDELEQITGGIGWQYLEKEEICY
ncbi:MAG: bacteriocin [Eubacteriales bacterium]|nr:bacteriocin [Eubacteriales bacterium]